jgi:hypothetical protein
LDHQAADTDKSVAELIVAKSLGRASTNSISLGNSLEQSSIGTVIDSHNTIAMGKMLALCRTPVLLILRSHPSGRGLDEILTVMRLGLSEHLEPVLSSNDLIVRRSLSACSFNNLALLSKRSEPLA